MKIRKQRKRNYNKKIIKKIIDFFPIPLYNSIKAAGAGLSGSGSLNTIFGGYAMKKKVTKSFALDELTLEAIQEIKEYLDLKNDSSVITYAIFELASNKTNNEILLRLDQEIAKRRYYRALSKFKK